MAEGLQRDRWRCVSDGVEAPAAAAAFSTARDASVCDASVCDASSIPELLAVSEILSPATPDEIRPLPRPLFDRRPFDGAVDAEAARALSRVAPTLAALAFGAPRPGDSGLALVAPPRPAPASATSPRMRPPSARPAPVLPASLLPASLLPVAEPTTLVPATLVPATLVPTTPLPVPRAQPVPISRVQMSAREPDIAGKVAAGPALPVSLSTSSSVPALRLAVETVAEPAPQTAPARPALRRFARGATLVVAVATVAAAMAFFGAPGARRALVTAQPRLVVLESRRVAPGERVPLGVGLAAPKGQADGVVVEGVAPGAIVTGAVFTGAVSTGAVFTGGTEGEGGRWQLSRSALASAEIVPPPGFIGPMTLHVSLRDAAGLVLDRATTAVRWGSPAIVSADASADSSVASGAAADTTGQGTSAQEAAAAPFAAGIDRDEAELLLARGQDFLLDGDLDAGRLLLQRASRGGDARAALLIGATFDPDLLPRLDLAATPDPAQARAWYRRAAALGSPVAVSQLGRLDAARREEASAAPDGAVAALSPSH